MTDFFTMSFLSKKVTSGLPFYVSPLSVDEKSMGK